jgi:hypothetical protein
MDGSFGIQIVKSKIIVILKDGVVGDLSRNDLTKNTHDALLFQKIPEEMIALAAVKKP